MTRHILAATIPALVMALATGAELVGFQLTPTPGSKATYVDTAGREWCATVAAVQLGVGGVPWAWMTIDADPRRGVRAPVSDLRAGCATKD